MRLFAERGFDAVTVAEIARAAGVTEKTVFNHFKTKEDLVYGNDQAFESALLDVVRTRPHGEPVLRAVERFLLDRYRRIDPPARRRAHTLATLVTQSTALRSRERRIHDRYADALCELIASEQDAAPGDIRPRLTADALLTVHRESIAAIRDAILSGALDADLADRAVTTARQGFALLADGLAAYAPVPHRDGRSLVFAAQRQFRRFVEILAAMSSETGCRRSEVMTMPETGTGGGGDRSRPAEGLKKSGQAMMVRTLEKASSGIEGLTQRLNDAADGKGAGKKAAAAGAAKLAKGASPLKAGLGAGVAGAKEKVKETVGAGGGGKDGGGAGKAKVTNIVEEFDVGLPRRVAYDQWTRFADYPSFTKKVESVEQESDEKVNWRAQILWSHRSWESTITEQIPDERIVWTSKGSHGYVDGAVTFHELAPTMTRILLVAEYHPDGFFEKTANLWRAQGRRLRLDFKNIKRHMMTQTLLNQEEVDGWRGEIRDGEVVKTHEEAVKGEQDQDREHERA